MSLSQRWFLDGFDLWLKYNIVLEEGSADFLKYAPKKPSTEHDWGDDHGIDVDLSRIFLSKREGVLKFAILCNSESEFFQKHEAFLAQWTQPGLRRLEFTAHNNKSYFVYYQETNNYEQVTSLKGLVGTTYKIAHRFTMTVIEPEPKLDASNIFINDDQGRFIVT